MNTSQFYYAHNVLGISSFLKPQKIHSTYRLYNTSEKELEFLFFCQELHPSSLLSQKQALKGSNKSINTEKNNSLIQKIAQALGSSHYATVEVLDLKSPYLPFVLNNLLTRFVPKGFVIFGSDLASHLKPKDLIAQNSEENLTLEINKLKTKYPHKISVKNLYGKITETIAINKNQHQSISGCILNKLSDFTEPDLKTVQERKKQAWEILKQVFSR